MAIGVVSYGDDIIIEEAYGTAVVLERGAQYIYWVAFSKMVGRLGTGYTLFAIVGGLCISGGS